MERFGEAFKGKLEYAYHRTYENNVPSIVRDGFIPGDGDMYGKGWYMCYDLESQLRSKMVSYGPAVIKTQIFDKGVLIFDYNISKEMFGAKYTLVDQMLRYGIFSKESDIPKHYKDMSAACEESFSNPKRSAEVAYQCFVQGRDPIAYFTGGRTQGYMWGEGNSCLNKKGVPKNNKITAIVFSGNNDGNVVVGYSPNTVLPVSYAIIGYDKCEEYANGNLKVEDIEFIKLKDYEMAEERARQARELYERLGVLRNSSIISLDLQYAKMTTAEFEKNFRWIAKDSKVTEAEVVIDKDGKFLFVGGSWDNGLWQGDVFGDPLVTYINQPVFKGGIFSKGLFLGDWEYGRFTGGTFKGRWRGKGAKNLGGIWSAPPECWDEHAVLVSGARFMYETKPGSGKYVESELTPPEFYKMLQGPEVQFSEDKKTLIKFDKKFTGSYIVPDGVENISSNAFTHSNISSITFPNSLKYIGIGAFSYCTNLSTIKFGNGLISIGEFAFESCSKLNSCTLPTGLQRIENSAFKGSGITRIEIPNSVKELGSEVFAYCPNLSSVKLSSSISSKEVPAYSFKGCPRLFNVEIPDNFTSIGECAFNECEKLRKIVLPSNLQVIQSYAFAGCDLNEISIPSKTSEIFKFAFASNFNVSKILLPTSLKLLDQAAFGYNRKITEIDYAGTSSQWSIVSKSPFWRIDTMIQTINCKDGPIPA